MMVLEYSSTSRTYSSTSTRESIAILARVSCFLRFDSLSQQQPDPNGVRCEVARAAAALAAARMAALADAAWRAAASGGDVVFQAVATLGNLVLAHEMVLRLCGKDAVRGGVLLRDFFLRASSALEIVRAHFDRTAGPALDPAFAAGALRACLDLVPVCLHRPGVHALVPPVLVADVLGQLADVLAAQVDGARGLVHAGVFSRVAAAFHDDDYDSGGGQGGEECDDNSGYGAAAHGGGRGRIASGARELLARLRDTRRAAVEFMRTEVVALRCVCTCVRASAEITACAVTDAHQHAIRDDTPPRPRPA